ncbi:unnamed protein product [Brachionus calyciflorus]|uniref:Uncharacterized protein n=1 Tax=Brachionus calyciflorus TaxID=104777 RepID=A0A814BEE2_9BILA|nr:unnamed protein product [Brachionus calyciflorus]
MAPTNSNAKSSTAKQTQSSNISKPILEKPQVLRTNKDALNVQSQKNGEIMSILYDLVKRFDLLSTEYNSLKDSIDGVKNESRCEIDNILQRLERNQLQETAPASTVQPLFSREIVTQAFLQLGVDLNVELVYEGKNLLALVLFNRNNINIYGTKMLGKLFRKKEMSEGTVEPIRTSTPALDPVRINLIKACDLKKLKTIEAFEDNWDNIVRSLRQKCLDLKKYLIKHPEAADFIEDENEQNDDEENDEIPNEQPTSNIPIARDVSMSSLQMA